MYSFWCNVFGSCVLVHAETCILVCSCCDLINFNTWFSQLTQNFMYEAATKQLLMQKLLIDEFQYSTCCNKFRTFIIKVTSICNIYFTEIKKTYSLRHESKHYNDALFAQNDENSRNTCIYKSQCSYSNACKEYNMSMWHYVQSCSISHSKPRPRDKRNE